MMKKSRYSIRCSKEILLQDVLGPVQRVVYSAILLFAILLSCKQSPKPLSQSAAAGNQQLPKAKAVISHSKGFTIEYFDNYKVVSILNRFSDRGDTLQYLLVQRGTPVPAQYPGAQVIQIPVEKMMVTSSMHVGLAEYAQAADRLTGLADAKYVVSPAVRKNMAAGKVTEVGKGGVLNDELIISLHPGLVMTMGSPDAQFSRYQNLIEAGVPVMINSEWLETDPLGRSEWVKLMAALVNKEALVNKKFEAMEREYKRLANLTSGVEKRPSVIVGMPFKDSWFVPDGDSYMARFLKDAGAGYHWSHVKGTGSLALDFETVSPVALNADFWIHPGSAHSKEDITAKDVRYADFKSFRQGTVYNNNKRENETGSNDYWESGAVNPHVILADLITIFHPDLLPGHQLVYYKQLK